MCQIIEIFCARREMQRAMPLRQKGQPSHFVSPKRSSSTARSGSVIFNCPSAEDRRSAFADRTPGILRYYQERVRAQAEHKKNPEMAESEPAADDLMKIYQDALSELEKKGNWE